MPTCPLPAALLALVVTGALVAPPVASATSRPDTEARNRQIVTEAFERWQAGGTGFFNEVLSADVVWTIEAPAPPPAGTRAAMRSSRAGFARWSAASPPPFARWRRRCGPMATM